MELTGQQLIGASQAITWKALNDPEMLKQCIAGCESIELTGENQYLAKMAVRIGPVNAKFTGKLQLSEINEPTSYMIHFDGQGGVAGFGKGSAKVQLTPVGEQTQLDYTANAQVGGKLAQIGSRLVDSAARKIADDFFKEFNARVAASVAPGDAPESLGASGSATAPSALPASARQAPAATQRSWLWPAVALVVGIIIGWLAK